MNAFKQRLTLLGFKITILTANDIHIPLVAQFSFSLRQHFRFTAHKKYRRPFFACARHQLFPEIGTGNAGNLRLRVLLRTERTTLMPSAYLNSAALINSLTSALSSMVSIFQH